MSQYITLNHNQNVQISIGNRKLGSDTMIFNITSATDCPSRKKGMCLVGAKCYALKAEKQYPHVLLYRERQSEYWKKTPASGIIKDLRNMTERHKRLFQKIRYSRFNESGDFRNQGDIKKLDYISCYLESAHQITTYGYSARKDLDFSSVNFLVKSSGHSNGNNGWTAVISKNHAETLRSFGYTICPGLCFGCIFCKEKNNTNILIIQH